MFEKLSRRTQQLADSVVDRVDNLIKEHEKLRLKNKELRTLVNILKTNYNSLLSIPEVVKILSDAEKEKLDYINNLLRGGTDASMGNVGLSPNVSV